MLTYERRRDVSFFQYYYKHDYPDGFFFLPAGMD